MTELRVSYRDAMNEKIAEIEQREEQLREALEQVAMAASFDTEDLTSRSVREAVGEIARAALAENGDSDA